MGLIVGFVAVAMVSAMYGIYNQVNFSGGTKGLIHVFSLWF
jgi:Flp pilus assembly pilin Flp